MKYFVATTLALLIGLPVSADEYEPALRSYAEEHLSGWIADPALIEAIRSQNAISSTYSQADIDALDLRWRAEIGGVDQPTITPVLGNPAAEFLRARIADSQGIIAEAFVMDQVGLNVAASAPTSDYWQGDEAKHSESFGAGAGAIHVGDVEFDESAQVYLGQVSLSITDPDTQEVIGAITVGLNAEALF